MRDERRHREQGTRGGSGWSPSGVGLSLVIHLMAVALIFFAPHPMPAPHPTAYTVELVDPNALGGKLLEGPIGGGETKPAPVKAPPPEPPAPEPPPPQPEPPAEEPPPEQVAKVDEPPPPAEPEDEEDPEAVPLGTPRATVVVTATPQAQATARATQQPTARPTARATVKATAKPSPRPTASPAQAPKPKSTATAVIVIARKTAVPAPASTARFVNVPATPGGVARPKPQATADGGADLDDKLAEAIKGVQKKVEQSGGGSGGGTGRGVAGATGPGGGQGGTERSLDGPAGIGGDGPGGGGTVRGLEFVVYYNQMLNRIKERWTWVGTRGDLRVTVSFSILPSGEITNIRLVERSGDQTYDASVERAVKGAGPLPPPPEAYRGDFADVELKFRPADLQR
jgi:TolA protein